MPDGSSSIERRLRWLGTLAVCVCLGCAQSEVLDLNGYDAGATRASGSGGTGPDADSNRGPGSGGSGPATGTGGFPASGQGGSITSTGAAGDGSGGMTGGTGIGGNTGGAGPGTGTGSGGASGSRGGSAGAGQSGTGGGAGHGQGGAAGRVSAGGSGGAGGTAPTFTTVYSKILVIYCAGSSCHNPGTSGGLSFATQASAYAAVTPLVTPGDGAGSDFYSTVQSGAMPKGRSKLSATNLALIKAWIDAGALDD